MIETNQIAAGGWNMSNLKNPRLQALMRYWQEKRGSGAMPSRADIDPLHIARLLPIVLVSEIFEGQARIRLLGSETTAAYGIEMRGRFVRDFELGSFTPIWLEAFAAVTRSAAISFASGVFKRESRQCHAEVALMPLSDNGESISHIFGGLIIKPVARNSIIPAQIPAFYVLQTPRSANGDFQNRLLG